MNAKQLFQKYHKRMVAEGILKATLIGLMAALTVLFVTAAVCWFVGFKGDAQDSVNNNGNLTSGEGNIIGDYFDGISN